MKKNGHAEKSKDNISRSFAQFHRQTEAGGDVKDADAQVRPEKIRGGKGSRLRRRTLAEELPAGSEAIKAGRLAVSLKALLSRRGQEWKTK